jgi:DNA repair photolyase
VRWDNLTTTDDPAAGVAPAAAPLPLALPLALPVRGAVVRTFDTPGFAGMTFYEVRARSIINRVPAAARMFFEWTINPYRGCSHACAYCISGDTPVLMADGRTRPLAEVQVGDKIYGTIREGAYRRYVITEVVAHWSTVKPAFRVTLEDGTELIASGDHRFLSDRGWKHVIGTMCGPNTRPFLTTGNKLMGFGGFPEPPKDTPDYRRGYLCGLIRGDGNLGSYGYRRQGRPSGMVSRFRLALVDGEALDRARRYLADLGVPTAEYLFQKAVGNRKPVRAIGTQKRAHVHAIEELISWPDRLTAGWSKGFLAGIFDAEGSCSSGILRISNTDQEIVAWTQWCLRQLGFDATLEDPGKPNGLRCLRLLGGLKERIRFFVMVDPAITRKRAIDGVAIRGDAELRVVSIEPLGFDLPMFDITTGTGDFIANGVVSHNCFARNTHTYLDLDAGHDFDTKVVVKVNAGELLRKELAAPRWRRAHIAMGTNVDCYQRAEGRYRLMPQIITALRDFANPFSILTKGTLILRDLSLLRQAAEVTDVSVAFSVGSVDEHMWRSVESGTPSPRRRLDAVRAFADAGFSVGVLMAPILPGLTDTDESIEATVAAIAESGAASVTPLPLHLRPGARGWYLQWLSREFPALLPRYRKLFGGGSYSQKAYQTEVVSRVRDAARRHGMNRDRHPARAQATGAAGADHAEAAGLDASREPAPPAKVSGPGRDALREPAPSDAERRARTDGAEQLTLL